MKRTEQDDKRTIKDTLTVLSRVLKNVPKTENISAEPNTNSGGGYDGICLFWVFPVLIKFQYPLYPPPYFFKPTF